mmetsp:Transcript_30529/g.89234  ORF Transcript_30529/g.89234 Transcript_30529/m.89234 type:complete len:348 (-) Transcript_30529:1950-2993(-)
MPRTASSRKKAAVVAAAAAAVADPEEYSDNDEGAEDVSMMFSQQMPEMSQALPEAKDREKQHLDSLDPHVREKLLTTLSRLLLFKALAGETIDKTKVYNEAKAELTDSLTKKVTTAAFEEAKKRLRDVFGFELAMIPENQVQNLSKTYQNRYYVLNKVREDGTHSKIMHSVHTSSSVEKGLLMLVLALCYCRGETRQGHRWIDEDTLYRLLNSIDENIPEEPPAHSSGGKKGAGRSRTANASSVADDEDDDESGPYGTPDVDTAIERFLHMDYLIKEKVMAVGAAASDAGQIQYAMGPRSHLEVGRKQVICFCAEILGEEPDPTMLAELEESEDEEEEVGDDEEGEE